MPTWLTSAVVAAVTGITVSVTCACYRQISTHWYFWPVQTCSDLHFEAPIGGMRGGSMGRTAGGTIGHIRGAQIGSMSRELEQTASTSPFMHGATSGPDACCDEGLQCLSCGQFVSVHLEGNPPVTPVPRCECGGELSRDHFLFCPQCRSKKLRYEMAYIT
jgi:hypothetical protein